jgi:putative membrane protein
MWGCNSGYFLGVTCDWHWLIIVVAIAFLASYLLCKRGKKPVNQDRLDSLEILKRKLALGEITLEEFDKLKQVL